MSSSLTNHNASNYARHANFVYSAEYASPVLNLLNPQAGERIADLGCGTGELTAQIAKAVGNGGFVFGVDSSESMLTKARSNSTDPDAAKITWHQADIQNLPILLDPSLRGTFDAVFTSATLHWCKRDPAGVVEGIKWLLKPGGRVAFEFGGFGNCAGVRGPMRHVLRAHGHDDEALDPFYYPTDKQYERLLRSHGLETTSCQLYPRPTPLSTDLHGWLTMFIRNTAFSTFSDDVAEQYMREIVEMAKIDTYWSDNEVGYGLENGNAHADVAGDAKDKGKAQEGWNLMYVRLRGLAVKPPSRQSE